MQKRYGYLKIREEIELGRRGLVVWAYRRSGKFLARVEINHAGLAMFTGKRGRKKLGDLSWETLMAQLSK